MFLQEGHIVLIIGPLPEVIESRVKEAIHDYQYGWEISLIEQRDDNQQKVHWRVVNHLEDKGLDLVAQIIEEIISDSDVYLRHLLRVLFGLVDDNLLDVLGQFHVVKDEVGVGEDE